jgi:hypothetical protein
MPIDLNSTTLHLLLPLIISMIGGGLAGSILNVLYAGRRGRRELTLHLIEEFLRRRGEFTEVGSLLAGAPVSLEDASALGRVRAAGDWFELVAAVCNKKLADRRLLKDIGIAAIISSFKQRIAETGMKELEDQLAQWENISSYKTT